MQENTEVTENVEEQVNVTETTEDVQDQVETPENAQVENLDEMSTEELTTKRMGNFKVGLSYSDAVYYRNLLDKSEYTGPNQAYLLAVSKAELSQVCNGLKNQDKNSRYEVQLTSATIESLGFYMNKHTGKGSDSASKLFSASMLLRPVMGEINKIDDILNSRKESDKA
jgi:hypothetical protein